jgi:hypothetical protein
MIFGHRGDVAGRENQVNKSSIRLLAVTLAVLSSVTLSAQVADTSIEPFGLRRGMTEKAVIELVGLNSVLPNKTAAASDLLRLGKVPQPHPAFEEYRLYFSPSDGLLKIHAIGLTVSTNSFGEELQNAFANICGALKAKYGAPKGGIYDHLKSGSIWNEPQDWMMGLLKNERDLFAIWNWSNGDGGITLSVNPLSRESGYLTLDYEFSGWEKFVNSREAKQNEVF